MNGHAERVKGVLDPYPEHSQLEAIMAELKAIRELLEEIKGIVSEP